MRGQEMFGRGKEEKHKEKKRVANEWFKEARWLWPL
jgi:hypothetical protein